jgi:hypothetical protein
MSTICEELIAFKNTFCDKQSMSLGEFEQWVTTIRDKAQSMENGLLRRKEFLQKQGLEEQYQDFKRNEHRYGYKNIPDAVNEVPSDSGALMRKGHPDIEITVKEGGKILYHNKGVALTACFVERIHSIDNRVGIIQAQHQHLIAGYPMGMAYAFDQLQQKMKEILPAIMLKALEVSDPKAFKRISGTDKNDALSRLTEAMKNR